MKNWIEQARVTMMLLSGCFGLALLTGCQSLQDTSFAPLDARLEPIPGGGAQHFVVVNASGQVLHNFHFRAYMWDPRASTYTMDYNTPSFPQSVQTMTYTFDCSGSQWEPGQAQHFKDRDYAGGEISILKPVSRVEIVGNCDEGHFREDWQMTASGQLQMIGITPHAGQP